MRSELSTRYTTKSPKYCFGPTVKLLRWLTVQQSDVMWRRIHSAKKDGRESQCDEVTTRRGVVPRAHATFWLASGIVLLVTPLASDMVEEGMDLADLDKRLHAWSW